MGRSRIAALVASVVVAASISSLAAQTGIGNAFTYQGRLTDSGALANGSYDLQFTLFDAATNGNQVGSPITQTSIAVSNGVFTVLLDFGTGIFTGNARWLSIGVRPGATSGGFTTIATRQQLTPSPNAIYSLVAGNALQLGGVAASSYAKTGDPIAASTITSGTLADARLSANVPLLDGTSKLPVSFLPVGTTAGTVAAGNDSRFTNVPAGSPNYIQNNPAGTQAANFNINGIAEAGYFQMLNSGAIACSASVAGSVSFDGANLRFCDGVSWNQVHFNVMFFQTGTSFSVTCPTSGFSADFVNFSVTPFQSPRLLSVDVPNTHATSGAIIFRVVDGSDNEVGRAQFNFTGQTQTASFMIPVLNVPNGNVFHLQCTADQSGASVSNGNIRMVLF